MNKTIPRILAMLAVALPPAALAALGTAGHSARAAEGALAGQAQPFQSPAPDRLRADFVRTLDGLQAKFFSKEGAFLQDSAHIHVAAIAAACEMRAWQWTKQERYWRSAVARLRLIAAKEDKIREADFFTPFPLSFACRAADDALKIDDDLRAALEKFASRRLKARDFASLSNQTMTRACGLELAAQVWPRLPQARQWHDYAVTIAAMLARIEDIPENAPEYNALDLVCTWLLADLLKRPELAAQPGIAAMFRRYRDQVSPAGFLAPYGDSGGAPRPFNPDWPMTSTWAHYVAAFERAAREYRDPTLRWAAARLACAGQAHMPLGNSYTDIEPLFYGSFAPDWMDPGLALQAPQPGSQVLVRRDDESPAALDKMILAASRQPGAPFVMTDLYCRGAHGHVNQHAAITYFEFHDTPLLTALGYNSREPAQANLLLMGSAAEPFPQTPGGFTPGVWHRADLPTSRLPPGDPSQPFLRRIDALNFRITAGRKGVVFTAADLELAGSTKPAIVVDDLRSAQGWRGNPRMAGEGLAWEVPAGVHFLDKAGPGTLFDCREHPLLTFRWKLSNNDEQARPVILRVQCGESSVDYHAHAQQLDPRLVRAAVEERDGIQRGTLRYTGWFTPDTALCRQMALTKCGVLVVCDTLLPGESARGMVAGPIWHVASTDPVAAGPHWFNSAGGKMELLTWFTEARSRTFGTQTTNVWSKDNQQTVFARQSLQPGEPVTFISVLVPHARGTGPAELAAPLSARDSAPGHVRVEVARSEPAVEFSEADISP